MRLQIPLSLLDYQENPYHLLSLGAWVDHNFKQKIQHNFRFNQKALDYAFSVIKLRPWIPHWKPHIPPLILDNPIKFIRAGQHTEILEFLLCSPVEWEYESFETGPFGKTIEHLSIDLDLNPNPIPAIDPMLRAPEYRDEALHYLANTLPTIPCFGKFNDEGGSPCKDCRVRGLCYLNTGSSKHPTE